MRIEQKLTYTFHDPNTPEDWERFLVKWYAEAYVEIIKKQMKKDKKDNKSTSE